MISNRMSVFITSFLQVTFISMNVVFISKGAVIPMLCTGFSISMLWTFNVKKMAFSNLTDRVVYATGAMIGTLVGYFITTLI